MKSGAAKAWWVFLTILLGLAIWLSASGTLLLRGLPLPLLESLAQARGLVGTSTPNWGGVLLTKLPGDLLAWTVALTVVANLLGALALYLAGRWTWKNPVSPALAVGVAYFAEKTLWLATTSPAESLTHLATSLALASLLAGAVPLLGLFILVLGLLSPAQAVMLLPALAYLSYRRQPAYGLILPSVVLLGVGGLLIPLSGDYRLQPGLSGWSWLTLAPLFLAFWPDSVRQARGGIYLTLLLGSLLTGRAELASVVALGDLAFLGLAWLEQPTSESPLPGTALRVSWLLGFLATSLFIAAVLPGERYLNRRVLIPAQKARVPFPELWRFFSLDRHARRAAQDSWRANVPFPEMTSRDFELALELPESSISQGICPLTLDSPLESRRVALLYALVSGQSLGGWDSPRHLAGPLLLCKLRGKNLLSDGPLVIVRRADSVQVGAPAAKLDNTPAELDLRRVMVLPYRPQTVSVKPGGGYRWISAGGDLEVVFHDAPAEVLLSAEPGEIRIVSSHPSHAVRHLEVPNFSATLSGLPEESLPSRSLVPLQLRLKNTGELAFSSEMLSRWRMETAGVESFGPFTQQPRKDYLLFPGESTVLELDIATPEAEGLLWLKAFAMTPDGEKFQLELEQSVPLRTWCRTPPVGTWVEEP